VRSIAIRYSYPYRVCAREKTFAIVNQSGQRVLAIVNPAAGGGKCGKLAPQALAKLRSAGLAVDVVETATAGDATRAARAGYEQGIRNFIAVGGDGTSYEIVNGLFPPAKTGSRAALGFLPLGTGNSFLRDFTKEGLAHAMQAILEGKRRPCDVMQLTYESGVLYYINMLSLGFTADVAALVNRRFKPLGEVGYLLGVLTRLVQLRRGVFPLRVDAESRFDTDRSLFLAFTNSKFTGGRMMIAPNAATDSGQIEYVRWGPIGRVGAIFNLHTLFDGSHLKHPLASRRSALRIEFRLDRPVDIVVDGEVLTLQPTLLEVLPGALDVMA
jgi:YegS/Rv2252/BmrU family lipid kinase